MIGVPLDYYWDMEPIHYARFVDVYSKKREQELRETDILNWTLGRYIAFAVNKPKDYPKKPVYYKEESKVMTAEEMERLARRMTKSLNKKPNGN